MRTFDRPVWVLLLVFMNVVGGLMRLCVGRPNASPTVDPGPCPPLPAGPGVGEAWCADYPLSSCSRPSDLRRPGVRRVGSGF
jgi:hypothetical protein